MTSFPRLNHVPQRSLGMPTTGQPKASGPEPTRTPRWQADLAAYGRRESVARAVGVLGLHGVRSGVARSGAFASLAGGPAISHGTRMLNTTRTTVPHAFLGHTRRITTSACTANARRERVTAVPEACDSQLHDERCSSKKPVPVSRATGTPAGSVTKTSLHPQWSISTSRRLRVHARQLAVHAALEPFGLC